MSSPLEPNQIGVSPLSTVPIPFHIALPTAKSKLEKTSKPLDFWVAQSNIFQPLSSDSNSDPVLNPINKALQFAHRFKTGTNELRSHLLESEDILKLILQHLDFYGYHASAHLLSKESGLEIPKTPQSRLPNGKFPPTQEGTSSIKTETSQLCSLLTLSIHRVNEIWDSDIGMKELHPDYDPFPIASHFMNLDSETKTFSHAPFPSRGRSESMAIQLKKLDTDPHLSKPQVDAEKLKLYKHHLVRQLKSLGIPSSIEHHLQVRVEIGDTTIHVPGLKSTGGKLSSDPFLYSRLQSFMPQTMTPFWQSIVAPMSPLNIIYLTPDDPENSLKPVKGQNPLATSGNQVASSVAPSATPSNSSTSTSNSNANSNQNLPVPSPLSSSTPSSSSPASGSTGNISNTGSSSSLTEMGKLQTSSSNSSLSPISPAEDQDLFPIKAATLNRIIQRLTSPDMKSSENFDFVKCFILTFPNYSDLKTVIGKLLHRYHVPTRSTLLDYISNRAYGSVFVSDECMDIILEHCSDSIINKATQYCMSLLSIDNPENVPRPLLTARVVFKLGKKNLDALVAKIAPLTADVLSRFRNQLTLDGNRISQISEAEWGNVTYSIQKRVCILLDMIISQHFYSFSKDDLDTLIPFINNTVCVDHPSLGMMLNKTIDKMKNVHRLEIPNSLDNSLLPQQLRYLKIPSDVEAVLVNPELTNLLRPSIGLFETDQKKTALDVFFARMNSNSRGSTSASTNRNRKKNNRDIAGRNGYPDPVVPSNLLSGNCSIFDIAPLEIARQLCLIDMAYFSAIDPSKELMDLAWSNPSLKHRAKHVLSAAARFNSLSLWVATSILKKHRVRQRAKLFTKFVKLCGYLLRFRNFFSLLAIISGLNNSAISRLSFTMSEVKSSQREQFLVIRTAVSAKTNYKAYRARLREAESPCVPYLGISMSDLTFIEEGNKDWVDPIEYIKKNPSVLGDHELYSSPASVKDPLAVHPQKLVNMYKHLLIYRIISEIEHFQNGVYEFQPVPRIQSMLIHFSGNLSPDELFSLSNELEPRGADKSQVRY